MRPADTFTESLFTIRRLDDFVPENHPLRPVRKMANLAFKNIESLLSGMYAADIKGGRPSVAPEKLLRAMLLQIFYSIRFEPLLMEKTQYKLLFRWYVGLSMEDPVWVPTVFTKNRERLIAHDAVIELFNEVLAIPNRNEWFSGEHFSVDSTLIQAWAGYKSFARKDGSDDDTGNFKGKSSSIDTNESTTDADARLYRKRNTAGELRFMGHTLSDNRHGLIASAAVTIADSHAEREAAKVMTADVKQVADEQAQITLGADKGYDAAEFIEALRVLKGPPHVAQNTSDHKSAVSDCVAKSDGYAISPRNRKLIEQGFGWAKFIGPIRLLMLRGLKKVDQLFVLTLAAYKLTRMRTLEQIRLQAR